MKTREILKKYFGYDSFREGQEELINSIISGQDVFGIMPTGAGKSIIIDSIGLILGDKASKDIVRFGSDKAYVCAYFSDLSDELYKLCDENNIEYEVYRSL